METVSHIRIAQGQSFLQADEYTALYAAAEKLARMLSGLQASLQ